MGARLLDGRALASSKNQATKKAIESHQAHAGRPPRLDVVLVGDDAPSLVYVTKKQQAAARVGIDTRLHTLPAGTAHEDIVDLLEAAAGDDHVDGVVLQLPLPAPLEPLELFPHIPLTKDVDGLHPYTQGRILAGLETTFIPATPRAILWLIEHAGLAPRGLETVIVSHSNLIGKPLAAALVNQDATVTVCHKHTHDLASHTRRADLLITAAGVPGLITADHVKPGATVIDAATVRTDDDRITGDCTKDIQQAAGAWTPVPGGVGPVTVAALLANTMEGWHRRTR
jgi:methylenetetrahydrofolate dehydrogenase (NADP+) / methenyltetrahydrofolate cyclohydrolase